MYLDDVCDVGLTRRNPSPIVRAVLGVVPVLGHEGRRVDEEEIRNLFSLSSNRRRKKDLNVNQLKAMLN